MQLQQKIGDGCSSDLYLCDYEGKQCVVKVYKQNYSLKLRQKEIKILKCLDHPHILKIIDHHPDYNYFICEQMKADLFTIVKNKTRLEVRTVKHILLQLSETIQYLHKLNYVHRDIKLENVMLDNNLQIKLIDFGFAQIIDYLKQYISNCGTPNYLSPELQSEKNIQSKLLKQSDVFALAVHIFILYYGFPPFSEASLNCLYWKLIYEKKWIIFWKLANRNTQFNDVLFQELFEKMISPDPENRYTIEQVLDHPWIDGNHDLSELINII